MAEFESIANLEVAKVIYQKVTGVMNIQAHPRFLERPIKVLDIGGGNGVVGTLLKKQCEACCGSLSAEDFGLLVDYVNTDNSREAIRQSPGRAIQTDIANTYPILQNEAPFDYVLSVNPAASAHAYTSRELDSRGIRDEFIFNPIRVDLLRSAQAIRSSLARITLSSAALLLQEDGKYISAGFIDRDSFKGTTRYVKQFGLGLRIEQDEKVDLGDELRGLFVTFDTGKKQGRTFEKLKAIYGSYRVVIMRTKGLPDRAKVKDELAGEMKIYNDWVRFCRVQDQFGTW